MKRCLIVLAAWIICAGVCYGATFHGEIMDNNCARGGAHRPFMGKAKDCTEICVRRGATYVLYDRTNKSTYQLDDQKMSSGFAGDAVIVTGTYDEATKTIHVVHIAHVQAGF